MLLKKLDELTLSKPVRFNLQDPNSNSVVANNMCSSSVSEEDSGFLSTETAITKVCIMSINNHPNGVNHILRS